MQVFFEKVFLTRPFKALFVTSDDSIHEWRFRWQLDRMVSIITIATVALHCHPKFHLYCSLSVMQPPPPHAFNCFSSQLNCVLHRCWHYAYVIHTCWLLSPKTTDFHQKMKITLHNLHDQQNKVTFCVFCVECCYSLIPADGTRLLVAVTT